jgi:hypothetical protein
VGPDLTTRIEHAVRSQVPRLTPTNVKSSIAASNSAVIAGLDPAIHEVVLRAEL